VEWCRGRGWEGGVTRLERGEGVKKEVSLLLKAVYLWSPSRTRSKGRFYPFRGDKRSHENQRKIPGGLGEREGKALF